MAARWFDTSDGWGGGRVHEWHDDGPSAEVERHRAWIATKLFQGIGLIVLLTVAVVLLGSW